MGAKRRRDAKIPVYAAVTAAFRKECAKDAEYREKNAKSRVNGLVFADKVCYDNFVSNGIRMDALISVHPIFIFWRQK